MLRSTRRRPLRLTTTALAAGLIATACAGTGDSPGPSEPPAQGSDAPDAPEGDPPATADRRIVSLSPTSTEVLFAIGAGDQVVAVDDRSNFPADAPMTDLSGFTPNLEAIVAFEPDVVFLANDTDGLVDALEALEIDAVLHPAASDLDDAFAQMVRAGEITGTEEQAAELVTDLRAELDALTDDASDATGLSYYHELDPTFFSVTSDTFIGQVYDLFGLESVADGAGDASPFPQLSPEFIIDADPDLILATDDGDDPAAIASRPGWASISAVQQDRVTLVDADVASRWGPRVVEFARVVADVLADVA